MLNHYHLRTQLVAIHGKRNTGHFIIKPINQNPPDVHTQHLDSTNNCMSKVSFSKIEIYSTNVTIFVRWITYAPSRCWLELAKCTGSIFNFNNI
ncbi:hypothetical protein Zmor_026003 [Zophobas morio]|uniref:Uncharacterized protein n=1 Tax=Zophobas morio TaxID=2755281 RepID=A0AA38M4N7_9CUCU|nr:hypothetical protein Zmor_026003 [Zophobas morio]